ncbi:MAG TPA: TIGR02679 family protein [Longimicrobium sp.]|nr:TIGR02679 family protein [Longimicrobium sp.]
MRPEDARDLLALMTELGRLAEALQASFERNGRPAGLLKVLAYEESDALAALVGKRVKPGSGIKVAEVDRLLREKTRFHCSLKEALELYAHRPIVTRKERRAARAEAWRGAWSRCFGAVRDLGVGPEAHARVVTWLHGDERGVRSSYRRWGPDGLVGAVRTVAAAFDRLPGRGGEVVYLSELAAEVAGGQHGLDANTPAGRLLYYALAYTFPEAAQQAKRGSALWRTTLLTEAGIARGPVSSLVHAYGLDGDTEYLRGLRAAGLDRPLTLLSLRHLRDDVRAWRGVAFVVENPNVYAPLIDRLRVFDRRYHPTLVCTTGTLNLADWELLDALVRSGAHLFYSGDFDKEGLDAAAKVLARYPEAASPWRLSPADYRIAVQDDAVLDPASLQRLAPRFPELVAEMSARGRAGDQEKLIQVLASDLRLFVTEEITPPRRGEPGGRTSASPTR